MSQATVSRRAKMNDSEEVKKSGGRCALTVNEEVLLLHDIAYKIFIGDPPSQNNVFEMVSLAVYSNIYLLLLLLFCSFIAK